MFVVAPTTISREGGVGLMGENTRTWLVLIQAKSFGGYGTALVYRYVGKDSTII